MRIKSALCLLALAMLASGRAAFADQPPDQTTRTIDLRDLLQPIPDFAGPGPGLTVPAKAEAPPVDMEARLLATIDMALGGADAPSKMEVRDGQLVAAGTEAQHQALASLIAQLKQQRLIRINLEVRVIALTEPGAKALPDGLRNKIARASIKPQAMSEQEVDVLMGLMAARNESVRGLSAPNLTVFDQQRAFVQITTQQYYIADAKKDDQGKWTPVIEGAWTGIQVQVKAAVSADGGEVSAAVSGAMQGLLGFDEVPIDGTDIRKQVPKLDRIEFDRIAIGAGTVLLDAQPFPAREGVDADAKRPHILLVLVRLTPIAPAEAPRPATAPPTSR